MIYTPHLGFQYPSQERVWTLINAVTRSNLATPGLLIIGFILPKVRSCRNYYWQYPIHLHHKKKLFGQVLGELLKWFKANFINLHCVNLFAICHVTTLILLGHLWREASTWVLEEEEKSVVVILIVIVWCNQSLRLGMSGVGWFKFWALSALSDLYAPKIFPILVWLKTHPIWTSPNVISWLPCGAGP